MGMILVTHDLGVVANRTDDIVVMYAGPRRRAGAHRRALRPHPHALHRGAVALHPPADRGLAHPAPGHPGPTARPRHRDHRGAGSRRAVPMSRTIAARRSLPCAPPARDTSSGAGTRWARPKATPRWPTTSRPGSRPPWPSPGPGCATPAGRRRCPTARGFPDGGERHRPPARWGRPAAGRAPGGRVRVGPPPGAGRVRRELRRGRGRDPRPRGRVRLREVDDGARPRPHPQPRLGIGHLPGHRPHRTVAGRICDGRGPRSRWCSRTPSRRSTPAAVSSTP